MPIRENGLRIEEVDLRGAALHEDHDAGLRPRGEVRHPRGEWIGAGVVRREPALVGHERRQRQAS